jgi:Co/Zn/Cd efflux system component
MTLLLLFLFFQQAAQAVDTDTTRLITLAVAGFVASFVQSLIKRKTNDPNNSLPTIKGAAAHVLTLVLALSIALGVRWYQGELHAWTDVVRSMGVTLMSMVATYHLLIDKFGLVEKPTS